MTTLTPEHQHSEAVVQAAQWLADERELQRPIIPALRSRFNLTALGACEAAVLSQESEFLERHMDEKVRIDSAARLAD